MSCILGVEKKNTKKMNFIQILFYHASQDRLMSLFNLNDNFMEHQSNSKLR